MTENQTRALLEGAYAQVPTLPGFYLSYEEFRAKFNELASSQTEVPFDVDKLVDELYPDRKFEEEYQLQGSEEIIRAFRIEPNKLVITNSLKHKIERAIADLKPLNAEGWKAFAGVGNKVGKNEIQEMGFIGYKHAIESLFGKRYEFRTGDISQHEAPQQIRDTKSAEEIVSENEAIQKEIKSTAKPKDCVARPRQGSYIGNEIDKYAYFPKSKDNPAIRGWDAAVNELAVNKALDETWYYSNEDSEKQNKPILKNYLSYTFERLRYEDSVEREDAKKEGRKPKLKILENRKYAVWNTGLVDNIYEPIFAFFKKNDRSNPTVKQPWIFVAFNTANSSYQKIMSDFPYKPKRASYFDDPRELFYDTSAEAPTLDWEHFLKDNISRLPMGFIKKGFADAFEFMEAPETLQSPHKEAYYRRLADAIYANEDWKQYVTTRFKNAVNVALSRVAWNYKTAIPVYYPAAKKIQLLLPLALEDKHRIDVALVCNHKYNKEEGVNNYEGRTIFTLQMAYNNARLITRPDSDWLMAGKPA